MRVFNQDKTQELTTYDLNKGYLKADKLFICHHEAVEEVFPKYTLEYCRDEKGKTFIKKTVLVEGVLPKKAYDEHENIRVYIPYTQAELQVKYEQRVEELIRERYTLSQELAILRQRDTKPEEFSAYNAFAEVCKTQAKSEFGLA